MEHEDEGDLLAPADTGPGKPDPSKKDEYAKRQSRKSVKQEDHDKAKKGNFVDAAAMKEKVRQNLSKPQHQVTDYYYDVGIFQHIAKSPVFDKMTLAVIALNAVWIAVDTDHNSATILLEADPVFVFAENFFCLFFAFEWFARFMSFKRKRDGCKDAWFVFDTFMVTMMVLETWLFNLLLLLVLPEGGGGGNVGVMRLARLMRLSRMARMGKLLRVMPELMVMIKGMMAATRSVFFTLGLLVIVMYIFGIAFVQMSDGNPIADKYFIDVAGAMKTLLIYGIFLDSVLVISTELGPYPDLSAMFYLFVLTGALTIMNMLIGVLCEVVSAVAATEQEEMLVTYVHEKLSKVMEILDSDGGGSISKGEFTEIIENIDAVRCLDDVGVDVFALIDLADYIFEDDDAENKDEIELDFTKFMEVVLQLRGTNQATVKDIVDLRKFMRRSMLEAHKQTTKILDRLDDGARQYRELAQSSAAGQSNESVVVNKEVGSPSHTQYSADDAFAVDFPCNANLVANPNPICVHGAEWKFDVVHDQAESDLPPKPPQATPETKFLTFIPVMSSPLPSSAEGLALKGKWAPVVEGPTLSRCDASTSTVDLRPDGAASAAGSGRDGEKAGPTLMPPPHGGFFHGATTTTTTTFHGGDDSNDPRGTRAALQLTADRVDRRCTELEDRLVKAIAIGMGKASTQGGHTHSTFDRL